MDGKSCYNFGPINRWSLSEVLSRVLHEAPKTMRSLAVLASRIMAECWIQTGLNSETHPFVTSSTWLRSRYSWRKSLYCLRIFDRDRNLLSMRACNAIAIGNESPISTGKCLSWKAVASYICHQACESEPKRTCSVAHIACLLPWEVMADESSHYSKTYGATNYCRPLKDNAILGLRIAQSETRRTGYDPAERCLLGRGRNQWTLAEIAQQ